MCVIQGNRVNICRKYGLTLSLCQLYTISDPARAIKSDLVIHLAKQMIDEAKQMKGSLLTQVSEDLAYL